jgi:hypothetical protein
MTLEVGMDLVLMRSQTSGFNDLIGEVYRGNLTVFNGGRSTLQPIS